MQRLRRHGAGLLSEQSSGFLYGHTTVSQSPLYRSPLPLTFLSPPSHNDRVDLSSLKGKQVSLGGWSTLMQSHSLCLPSLLPSHPNSSQVTASFSTLSSFANSPVMMGGIDAYRDDSPASVRPPLSVLELMKRTRYSGRIKQVLKGGAIKVDCLGGVAQGSLVVVHSGSKDVGMVPGVVIALGSDSITVALCGHPHQVVVNDLVAVPITTSHSDSPQPVVYPSFPCTLAVVGRVVDAFGRPLDGEDHIKSKTRLNLRAGQLSSEPILARCSESKPLWTGIKMIDALHPVRRGLRIGVAGTRSTGSIDLVMKAILSIHRQSQSELAFRSEQKNDETTASINELAQPTLPPVIIYASIGNSRRTVQETISALSGADAMSNSVMIVASETDPPLMKHLAYLSAIAYANFIQEQGMHAIVVIDNLANHARAYYDLMLPVSPPSPSTIASLQAQQLETVSQLRGWAGGGSITAFAILDEKLVDHAFDDRKVTQVMEGIRSSIDHVISTDKEVAVTKLWPPVEASPVSHSLRFQVPLLRALVQRANATLALSKEAYERRETGDELGIMPGEDDLELIEWRPKLQLLLSQQPTSKIALNELFLLLFTALTPRLLAGIPVLKIPLFEMELLQRAHKEVPDILMEIEATMDRQSQVLEQAVWIDGELDAIRRRELLNLGLKVPMGNTSIPSIALSTDEPVGTRTLGTTSTHAATVPQKENLVLSSECSTMIERVHDDVTETRCPGLHGTTVKRLGKYVETVMKDFARRYN